jgi:branched-chain amino acid transport system substrate-binding protein
MRRDTRAIVAAVALASLAVAGCGRGAASNSGAAATTSGPLKVALITDTSGAVALFGQANVKGATLAVEQLNAAGGVNGRKVQLLVRDSKATPETGVQLTRDAVLRDKVSAILGPVSSAVAVAMTDVAKQYKTPIFFHTANSQALTGADFQKYAFSVVPNTTMEGRGNAIALKDAPYKRWAVIAPDYEFGHSQSQAFVDELRKLNPNAKVVKQVFPPLGEKDYSSYITALQAAKPDAVYGALFAGDLIAFTKQAKPLGFFDKTFFTSLYETDALRALGSGAPQGVRGYSRAPFFAINTPESQKFLTAYRARFNDYPSDWAIMAYDAVNLWAQGVEKAKSAKADDVVAALQGGTFDSTRGRITVRAADHQASVPVYAGTVEPDSKVGFDTWKDVKSIPADQVWLSGAELKKAQGG